jgi:TRAP-type transport system small permease protein
MIAQFEKFTSILASILMFALMLLTFIDVCGRNIFNQPLVGASEITELLLAAIIFFMLPKVALQHKHIVIDLVDAVAPAKFVGVLNVIAALLNAGFFLLIGWQIFVLAQKAAGYADATPSLHIPLAPALYVLGVLSVINGIAHLATIPDAFKKPEPGLKTDELSFTV